MSEFTEKYKIRIEQLGLYSIGLIEGRNGTEILEQYWILETTFYPKDILMLFDILFEKGYDIESIKTASNKLFNILFKNLTEFRRTGYPQNSLLYLLAKDNAGIKKQLAATRKNIKLVNAQTSNEILTALSEDFKQVERFTAHYLIMENIVFPEIERNWENHQCLKLMWSFHDDIRRNIKKTLEILDQHPFDLKRFNETVSKVYFNISTIVFREEHVLFPILSDSFSRELFGEMEQQLQEFDLAYADVQRGFRKDGKGEFRTGLLSKDNLVRLGTGVMSPEQIQLVFNHLPVDITFVDEHNRVKFFSAPKHRIFPRTTGIINRRVQDCHPNESVNVVEKIVESFRSGEKDEAAFWIRMGKKLILIIYYAVRDNDGNYKGVLEVSQEISGIQEIKGERRLLDW